MLTVHGRVRVSRCRHLADVFSSRVAGLVSDAQLVESGRHSHYERLPRTNTTYAAH